MSWNVIRGKFLLLDWIDLMLIDYFDFNLFNFCCFVFFILILENYYLNSDKSLFKSWFVNLI